ncbi:MAG: (d)CMP kinase [Chlamydiae bacterium]|nr:(d)CMP kinase [Chlamydiota bacterium]
MTHFIITIDGPSASGKSTLAKKIAQRLGINYLDSGAFYRSIAAYLISSNLESGGEEFFEKFLSHASLKIVYEKGFPRYFFNQVEVTPYLRKEKVAMLASLIAKLRAVRTFVNQNLRQISKNGDFIGDGRDLGSKVFPKADVKFFLTASVESRAKRRELEQKTMGIETSYKKVLEQLIQRDEQDLKRKIDPLIKPDDAFFIDTTYLTTDQVCEEMLLHIKKKFSLPLPVYRKWIVTFIKKILSYFYVFEIAGEEYAKRFPGGIVYANHSSYLDSLILLSLLGPATVFIASERVMNRNLFFRYLTFLFPVILINENRMPRDFFKQCNLAIHKGSSLVIFPEGERTKDGFVLSFKEGLSAIILHCKIQHILPVYIGGAYNIWPKDKIFFSLRGKISVLVSKTVQVSGFEDQPTKETKKKLTAHLEHRLKELEKHYKETYERRT